MQMAKTLAALYTSISKYYIENKNKSYTTTYSAVVLGSLKGISLTREVNINENKKVIKALLNILFL